MSRDKILANIKQNQPAGAPLPDLSVISSSQGNHGKVFEETLVRIGGAVLRVGSRLEISEYLQKNFPAPARWVSFVDEIGEKENELTDGHSLENVSLAILEASFGVAENGAVWITNQQMGDRALPFITQHLAIVINSDEILPTLHDAYLRIGASPYEYGTFIAGPSKTADIEQSLVLGAHGAKSHTVFLLE
jgi:L-lactate dehydrogenase complex protein LldG